MKMMTLGDVCKRGSSNIAQKDLATNNGDYPIYGASGLIKNVDFYHQDAEYIAVVKDGAGIGRTMLLPAKSSIIGTMQYLIPNANVEIDTKYLYYAVNAMNLAKYFSGATIPHIYFRDYQKEPIRVPELSEQHRIAAIFDEIDETIELRKSEINALDELVKSRFIELFGDPRINDKGYMTRPGSECFKLSNGKFVPESKRFSEGVPAYGGNGISWYTDDILFANDTIVVGRVGFQSGNVHLVRGPLWITDNAMYISQFFGAEYNLVFLEALMKHINFTRLQDAGDLKKITQKPFMEMGFIYPPIEKQREYAAFVAQTDKSKYYSSQSYNYCRQAEKYYRQEWMTCQILTF